MNMKDKKQYNKKYKGRGNLNWDKILHDKGIC